MSASAISAADQSAAAAVPKAIVSAWAANDADAFAAVFTEDAILILPGDVYLTSRAEIRDFMKRAYAGPYQGTRVFGEPLAVKFLADTAAVVVTRGGVLAPGETQVAPERAIRATWVLAKQGSEWLIAAYQNTPVNGA